MKKISIAAACFICAGLYGLPASAISWEHIYDGVEYGTYDKLHAVRIDVDMVGVNIFPRVSVKGEALSPTAWAQKHDLEIAVNANFYGSYPCSSAVSNGVNWGGPSGPDYAEIGFTKDYQLKWIERDKDVPDVAAVLYNAVAGTPEIIKNGITVTSGAAYDNACAGLGHCTHTRARTGICVDKSQKHLIIAVTRGDGNGGYTVPNFANAMLNLGCDYAINLDGGGSSGLYIKSKGTYGTNNQSRNVKVNLGFDIKAAPEYICKKTCVDNPSARFCDVPQNHWGLESIMKLAETNITGGCGKIGNNDYFCTECGMKRGDAAIFIARALKLQEINPSVPSFSDVPQNAYYYKAIETLAAKGIIAPNDKFRPEAVMLRCEAATMLAKGFIEDPESYKDAPTPTFDDAGKDYWAYPYIEALVRNCITQGISKTSFGSANPMTRVEFAVMLARAAGLVPMNTSACAFQKQCDVNGTATCTSSSTLEKCVAYESVETTCEAGTECTGNACTPAALCHNEAPTCETPTSVKSCGSDGKWKITECQSSEICDNGKCIASECSENDAPVCASDTQIKKCKDSKWTYIDCAGGESCSNGICSAAQCNINDPATCETPTSVKSCNPSGKWTVKECNDNEICDNGKCAAAECTAQDKPTCDTETKVKRCINSKWIFEECTGNNVCTDGYCGTPACTDQKDSCADSKTIKKCVGKKWTYEECQNGEICENGICAARECNNEKPSCQDENTLRVCSEKGRWESVPCLNNEKCSDGICGTTECSAKDKSSCINEITLKSCSDDGSWTYETCPDNTLCSDGECRKVQCSDGEVYCADKTTLKICTEDRKWKSKPCAEGEKCVKGECVQLSSEGDSEDTDTGDTDTDTPKDEETITYASSCSADPVSKHPVPWVLALIFGALGMMRRPRKEHS